LLELRAGGGQAGIRRACTPNGGFLSATNISLMGYIAFAYNLMGKDAQYLRH